MIRRRPAQRSGQSTQPLAAALQGLRFALPLGLALAAAGCGASGKNAKDLPSLRAVRSRVTPIEPPDVPQPTAAPEAVATIVSLDLPLDAPLADAWAYVDEQAVPASTRELWRANGLRIGVLEVSRTHDFYQALPAPLATGRSRVVGSTHPTAIRTTGLLRQTTHLELAPPSRTARQVPVTGGKLRLLLRMSADAGGHIYLDLLPHHFVPEVSLLPRDPLEKQLDGRIFDELGAHLVVDRRHMVVVGLHRPQPAAAPREDASEGEASPARRTALSPAPTSDGPPAPPPLQEDAPLDGATAVPYHLGRALLTASRAGHPTQRVMVIAVAPVH